MATVIAAHCHTPIVGARTIYRQQTKTRLASLIWAKHDWYANLADNLCELGELSQGATSSRDQASRRSDLHSTTRAANLGVRTHHYRPLTVPAL